MTLRVRGDGRVYPPEGRPECIKCILTPYGLEDERTHSICGYWVRGLFTFQSIDHAFCSVDRGSNLLPCADCMKVVRDTLRTGLDEAEERTIHMNHRDHYIMQFFAYDHLPPHLQEASKPFAQAAFTLHLTPLMDHLALLPENPERTFAIRKVRAAQQILKNEVEDGDRAAALRLLVEAKDCAVRAKIFKAPA